MSRRIVKKYDTKPVVESQLRYNPPHPDESEANSINYDNATLPTEKVRMVPQTMLREASFGSLLSDVSGNTDRSTSSLSWEEEIDAENSEKIKEAMLAIEEFLYEDKHPTNINEEIIEDCKTWSAQFPHLRIIGKSPPVSYNSDDIIHNTEREDNSDNEYFEEIIAQHSADCESSEHLSTDSTKVQNESDLSELKEKVLDELVKILLPKVLNWQNVINSPTTSVRPYSAIPRIKRSLRPMTAEENRLYLPPVSPISQPLQGILTISSKILQDRKIKSTGSIVPRFRPSSSTSGFLENGQNTLYSNSKRKLSRPRLTSIVPDSKYILQDNINNKSILPDITSPTRELTHNDKSFKYRQIYTANSRPGTGRIKITDIQEEASIPIIDIKSARSSAAMKRTNSRLHFDHL